MRSDQPLSGVFPVPSDASRFSGKPSSHQVSEGADPQEKPTRENEDLCVFGEGYRSSKSCALRMFLGRSEEGWDVPLDHQFEDTNMDQFLTASFSYPTIVYTTLLSIAVGYWLLSLVGIVGLDSLDFGADMDVDVDAEAHSDMAAAGFFQNAPIRVIPLSLALTLLFFFGWLVCHTAALYLGPVFNAGLPRLIWGTAILIFGTLIALVLANLAAIPLTPVFKTHASPRKKDLLGRTIEVRTGRVDEHFGSGVADSAGNVLIIEIRCEAGKLKRGDRALVIDYDPKIDCYSVEPLDEALRE